MTKDKQTTSVLDNLRHYVEEREHKTVGIFLPDGRSSCGVMVPVILLEDAISEIMRLKKLKNN